MYLVQLLFLLPWDVHSFNRYSRSTSHEPKNREITVNRQLWALLSPDLESQVWALAGTRDPLSEWRQSLALPPVGVYQQVN